MDTITRSATAFSWIDPQTGLPEVARNGHPGATTTRAIVLGERAYRFCNFIEIEIDIENGQIASTRFTVASGMYRSPSFAHIPSAMVGKIGRTSSIATNAVTVKQIVGCRTVSPETAGTVGGGGVGLGGALLVGAYVLGTGGWGLVALGAGGLLFGGVAGRETAEYVTGFPPIWTEIELTVTADGTTSQRCISHSLFPSSTFYRQKHEISDNQYEEVSNYNAVPALNRWKQHGWNEAPATRNGATSGNPWNMISGNNRFGGHTVNRPCPTGYDCS
jgi:hypothetical protein